MDDFTEMEKVWYV